MNDSTLLPEPPADHPNDDDPLNTHQAPLLFRRHLQQRRHEVSQERQRLLRLPAVTKSDYLQHRLRCCQRALELIDQHLALSSDSPSHPDELTTLLESLALHDHPSS